MPIDIELPNESGTTDLKTTTKVKGKPGSAPVRETYAPNIPTEMTDKGFTYRLPQDVPLKGTHPVHKK